MNIKNLKKKQEKFKQDEELLKIDNEVKKLKDEKGNYRKKYEKALDQIENLERKLHIVENIDIKNTKIVSIKPERKKITSESTAIVVASDWHLEEKVDPCTVNNLNRYTPSIAEKRVNNFFRSALKLIEIQRHGTYIDNLVLGLLGDFISGYIHEELMESNFMSPTEAIVFAFKLLKQGIDLFIKEGKFKNIKLICCQGNHGRTTLKPKISTASKNSFEWLLYYFIQNEYKDNDNVDIVISNGYHVYVDVFNTTIRFHHGDSINYRGGVGGITIPINKAISQWNKSKKADIDVFGHFHQFFDGGNFVVNGSVIGYNPYAIKIKASYESPQQTFFLISKKRGKTIHCPIFLD
jgi:predicted phosphodiesterase